MINCYSLKCRSLKTYNRPFYAFDDKEAVILVRNVLLNEDERELNSDRSDYDLYFVGEFNNSRGRFAGSSRLVCNVSDIPLPKSVEKTKGEEKNEV